MLASTPVGQNDKTVLCLYTVHTVITYYTVVTYYTPVSQCTPPIPIALSYKHCKIA